MTPIEKMIFIQYAWILADTFNTLADMSSWDKVGFFLTKVLSYLELWNFKICEFSSSSSYSVNYYFQKITKSLQQTLRRIIESVL